MARNLALVRNGGRGLAELLSTTCMGLEDSDFGSHPLELVCIRQSDLIFPNSISTVPINISAGSPNTAQAEERHP